MARGSRASPRKTARMASTCRMPARIVRRHLFQRDDAAAAGSWCKADGSRVAVINENKVAELADLPSVAGGIPFRAHSRRHAAERDDDQAAGFRSAKKYPVLVYTYGGPHAQVVLNAWGGATFLWHELMAHKGYIIFALDNRGSAGRGHLFEEPIHFRSGRAGTFRSARWRGVPEVAAVRGCETHRHLGLELRRAHDAARDVRRSARFQGGIRGRRR